LFILGVESLQAGGQLVIKTCRDGCPQDTASEFAYSDSVNGGFLRTKGAPNLVIGPKGKQVNGSIPLILNACGQNPQVAASLRVCAEETHAQFELLPMFDIEPQKEAINCVPYSHQLSELTGPKEADSQQEAQRLCAADNACSAYSWAKSSAVGDVKNKVFLCTKLHNVHAGVEGWELGVRAGRAYDSPYGEEFY